MKSENYPSDTGVDGRLLGYQLLEGGYRKFTLDGADRGLRVNTGLDLMVPKCDCCVENF